jgi:hypothetical protein
MMLYKWRHHQRGAESWEPELSFSRKNQSTAPRDYLTREERSKIRDASLEYGSVPSRENVRGEERDRWEAYLAQRFEKPKDEVRSAVSAQYHDTLRKEVRDFYQKAIRSRPEDDLD